MGKEGLRVFHHLPDAAGTDAGTKAASDAEVGVDIVPPRTVGGLTPGDGAVVAGRFTHVTVSAHGTGQTPV